ncbi:AzlD family protein [Rhodovibrionaceae bacterium A322]
MEKSTASVLGNPDLWSFDPQLLLLFLVMGVITYLTRISGFLLLSQRRLGPRWSAALEAVPAAVLLSLIAPMILTKGPAESAAALLTFFLASRLPSLLAILLGTIAVVLLRQIL